MRYVRYVGDEGHGNEEGKKGKWNETIERATTRDKSHGPDGMLSSLRPLPPRGAL